MKLERPVGRQARGAAAVELALLLPVLCLIMAIIVDYARVVSDLIVVTDCARAGALFAADPELAASTPYASVQEAALAGAARLDPAPTVTTRTGTDARGTAYVEVRVESTFRTVINYPGVPPTSTLRKTVRMPIRPS